MKFRKLNESNEHVLSKENSDKIKESMDNIQDVVYEFLPYMEKDMSISYNEANYFYKRIKEYSDIIYRAFIHDDNYPEEEDLSSYGMEYGYYN